MLVEDGELVLYDGRRLLSAARMKAEGFELPVEMQGIQDGTSATSGTALKVPCPQEIIPIHPSFRLIVLANRPGFPFHGNNLFRECGDIFSVHVVENLDLESEIALLQAYAPGNNLHIFLLPHTLTDGDLMQMSLWRQLDGWLCHSKICAWRTKIKSCRIRTQHERQCRW